MRPGRPSRTAEGVAMVRALEMVLRRPEDRVLEDPIARHLMGPRMRLFLAAWPITALIFRAHERRYRGMVYEVLARARFVQDRLVPLAAEGVRQVVILGAGFDATAWRTDLPDDLVVFEVDHPDTQRMKRRRLRAAGLPEPPGVRFVSLDLTSGGLARTLGGAGHDAGRSTLVTAMGLLPYLPLDRIEALFGEMKPTLGPGSEMIYTYFSRRALDPRRAPPAARRVAARLSRAGEPFLSSADPPEMAQLAAAAGLVQVETLDGAEMTARYFASRGDARIVGDWINLSRAIRS